MEKKSGSSQMKRRRFLQLAAGVGGAALLGLVPDRLQSPQSDTKKHPYREEFVDLPDVEHILKRSAVRVGDDQDVRFDEAYFNNLFETLTKSEGGREARVAAVKANLVKIVTSVGSGTGIRIDKDYIVTAAHLVLDFSSGDLENPEPLKSAPLLYMPSTGLQTVPRGLKHKLGDDLAILYTPIEVRQPIPDIKFNSDPPQLGDRLYAYGLTSDIAFRSMKMGLIEGVYKGPDLEDPPFLEIEGMRPPGFSGGPVVNAEGEIVAILSQGYADKLVEGAAPKVGREKYKGAIVSPIAQVLQVLTQATQYFK